MMKQTPLSENNADRSLEFVSEVQEEVQFLGVVAITNRATEWTDDGIVVVSKFSANERAMIKDVLHLVGLLANRHTQQHVMVLGDTLLGLKLGSNEVLIDKEQ